MGGANRLGAADRTACGCPARLCWHRHAPAVGARAQSVVMAIAVPGQRRAGMAGIAAVKLAVSRRLFDNEKDHGGNLSPGHNWGNP